MKITISNRQEETECTYCGFPVYVTDTAYWLPDSDNIYCSEACADAAAWWTSQPKGQAATRPPAYHATVTMLRTVTLTREFAGTDEQHVRAQIAQARDDGTLGEIEVTLVDKDATLINVENSYEDIAFANGNANANANTVE